jgi:hypothetical protein
MLNSIKQYLYISILFFVLGVVIYYGYKEIKQLNQLNQNLNRALDNNLKALNDSLRVIINGQNQKIYLQTAFINDLKLKQDKVLQEQGISLKALQEVSLKLDDIIFVIDSGVTQIGDSVISRTFYKDTSFTTIEGLTSINLRNDALSYTKLKLSNKEIPIEFGVGINEEDNTFVGIAKSLIPGISIKTMKTTLDPSIIGKFKKDEDVSFFSALSIGVKLGLSSQLMFDLPKSQIVYGFDVEFKNWGVWYLKIPDSQIYGIKKSFRISDLF